MRITRGAHVSGSSTHIHLPPDQIENLGQPYTFNQIQNRINQKKKDEINHPTWFSNQNMLNVTGLRGKVIGAFEIGWMDVVGRGQKQQNHDDTSDCKREMHLASDVDLVDVILKGN